MNEIISKLNVLYSTFDGTSIKVMIGREKNENIRPVILYKEY